MSEPPAVPADRALAPPRPRVRSDSALARRSVRSSRRGGTRWVPPDGVLPEDVQAVIAAATGERDRLLLRCLWATGGRISEVLALRALDVRRDSLVLPNRKNPDRPTKAVYLPAALATLPGDLLLWAREQALGERDPLFFSRKRTRDGARRAISRQQGWEIVRDASERAGITVLALRPSRYGAAGEPAPLHPHLFRHARVRQNLRATRNLPLVQRQAGWATLQMAYLTVGDAEARQLMQQVPE